MTASVADLVAQTLHAHGIRQAFGIPGGEILVVIDALEAVGISFILCRQETGAALMAAGAAAVSGAPGLLVTTLGPGLTSGVNGIAHASQDRVPLIVLSAVVEPELRGVYTHQILDQTVLLTSLVKGSFEVDVQNAPQTIARALRLATRPPFGPVHVQIAPTVAKRPAPAGAIAAAEPRRRRPRVDPRCEVVLEVAELIQNARRPLIVAGMEALYTGAGAALTAIVDRAAIPILTSYKGKGLVNERHPLCLGAAGLSPLADRALLPLIADADVVLLAGYDPIEMRAAWLNPFGRDAVVIEMTQCPADHGMHAVHLLVNANVGDFFLAVHEHLVTPESGSMRQVWAEITCADTRSQLRHLFRSRASFGPHSVFATLQMILPPNAITTVDSGAHRILLSQQYLVQTPGTLLQSSGLCTMGAAIPLAAGAKLVNREVPVIAVVGDGGLEMCLGELGTLRDHNLPIVIIVLQDESLSLIEIKQRQLGLAHAGVSLGRTSFGEIARGFGGLAYSVRSEAELAAALRSALDAPIFSLIACAIRTEDYVDAF